MVIKLLDSNTINQIAAGEVIERPSSIVKELVENAIDAGATRIAIDYVDGGKSFIRVTDNGSGIRTEDLPLAMTRHATSKIDGSNLLDIQSFGFRGEALPSLGAVGKLNIMSRCGEADGAELQVNGGKLSAVRPVAMQPGTRVTLSDLFYATPARLKFLRSDRAEAKSISDTIRRLAMAEPSISFTLRDMATERIILQVQAEQGDMFDALRGRLGQIMGNTFIENAITVDAEREGICLTGFAGLPTYSRGSAISQFLFVNGRPVRDKLLLGGLRGAYSDLLPRDRHPVVALFVECEPERVDVNVHPAKAEVRFRDPGIVRGLIVSGLRQSMAQAGHRTATTLADVALGKFEAQTISRVYQMDRVGNSFGYAASRENETIFDVQPSARTETEYQTETQNTPLGAARAQLHENYIISQTDQGLIIVDAHAAHERLLYEKLKAQLNNSRVLSQALLIPEVITLPEDEILLLLEQSDVLSKLGLTVEAFGQGAVSVQTIPAILGQINVEKLVLDIVDELSDGGSIQSLNSKIETILSLSLIHI